MKKSIKAIVGSFFILVLATACSTKSSPGPAAWIDQPLDNSHLPVAPVVITAHASDEDGVSSIEFYIGDTLLVSVAGDGGRLSSASAEWNPPGEGPYTIRVRGVDAAGNPGDFASAAIQVGAFPASETPASLAIQDTPTLTPTTASIGGTPTATFQSTQTITTTDQSGDTTIQARTNANCRKGPDTAYDIEDVLRKGKEAKIEGRNQDGSWVWIAAPSGGIGHCWISVEVGTIQGNLNSVAVVSAPPKPTLTTEGPALQTSAAITEVPATQTSTATTAVPPPPAPPVVSLTVSDGTLLNDGNPCTNYPKTTSASAVVSSGGSISQVTLYWNLNGAAGNTSMAPSGGNTYTASIGPFADPGTLTLWAVAVDSLGQTGSSSTTSIVVSSACIQ